MSVIGVGMCLYLFQKKCKKNIIKWIQEDEMIQVFEEKEEYTDIDLEQKLHICSLCKKRIGKKMIMYCFMDRFFCSERCRSLANCEN